MSDLTFDVIQVRTAVSFRPPSVAHVHACCCRRVGTQDADIDLRSQFYRQIVLSGGSTMYPGCVRARCTPAPAVTDTRNLLLSPQVAVAAGARHSPAVPEGNPQG